MIWCYSWTEMFVKCVQHGYYHAQSCISSVTEAAAERWHRSGYPSMQKYWTDNASSAMKRCFFCNMRIFICPEAHVLFVHMVIQMEMCFIQPSAVVLSLGNFKIHLQKWNLLLLHWHWGTSIIGSYAGKGEGHYRWWYV